MIEKLINEKTAAVLNDLDDEGRERFFEQGAISEEA
jgi:hypothetical protein